MEIKELIDLLPRLYNFKNDILVAEPTASRS